VESPDTSLGVHRDDERLAADRLAADRQVRPTGAVMQSGQDRCIARWGHEPSRNGRKKRKRSKENLFRLFSLLSAIRFMESPHDFSITHWDHEPSRNGRKERKSLWRQLKFTTDDN
jgi:hypothetical protein